MRVQGICQILVVNDKGAIEAAGSPEGKPYLKLVFPNGFQVNITTNLAEMIGGVGAGVRQRMEEVR